jgi:hypothetical protein
MRRRHCLVALALLIPVSGAAQETDTTRTFSPNHGGMTLGFIILTVGTFFAPPVFLFIGSDSLVRPTARPIFRESAATVYGAVGFTDRLDPKKSDASWTTAASVQVHHRRVFGEARIDEQGVERTYRLRSAEIGYLFVTQRRTGVGMSLGVQRSGRERTRDAVAVGLPLISGGRALSIRLEPRYVFSPRSLEWHYRAEVTGRVSRGSPFILGGSLEFKPLPERGPYHGVLAVLVGVRP